MGTYTAVGISTPAYRKFVFAADKKYTEYDAEAHQFGTGTYSYVESTRKITLDDSDAVNGLDFTYTFTFTESLSKLKLATTHGGGDYIHNVTKQ